MFTVVICGKVSFYLPQKIPGLLRIKVSQGEDRNVEKPNFFCPFCPEKYFPSHRNLIRPGFPQLPLALFTRFSLKLQMILIYEASVLLSADT